MNHLLSRLTYAPAVEFPLSVFTVRVWPSLAPVVYLMIPIR